MENFVITEIKLETSSNAKLTYKNDKGHEVVITMPEPVHEDMMALMKEIKAHVIRVYKLMGPLFDKEISDLTSAERSYLEILKRNLTPYILKFGGQDAIGNVIISAKLLIFDAKTVVIKTPAIIFEKDAYTHGHELLELCERAKAEAALYLNEGKNALGMKLPFDQDRELLRLDTVDAQAGEEGEDEPETHSTGEGPENDGSDAEQGASETGGESGAADGPKDEFDPMNYGQLRVKAVEMGVAFLHKNASELRTALREARALNEAD